MINFKIVLLREAYDASLTEITIGIVLFGFEPYLSFCNWHTLPLPLNRWVIAVRAGFSRKRETIELYFSPKVYKKIKIRIILKFLCKLISLIVWRMFSKHLTQSAQSINKNVSAQDKFIPS